MTGLTYTKYNLLMNKTLFVKRTLIALNYPRFIFHIIAFVFTSNRDIIAKDVCKAMSLWPYKFSIITSLVYLLWSDRFFRNLYYKRIGNFSFFLSLFAKPSESFVLDSSMIIGEGMMCIHPFSTVINAERIGKNFTVRNDVTIGNNDSIIGKISRPVIGDNVTVNVHSVIVGDITVGDNVIVGAGCILFKSVPDNCVVVGNPARIIKKDGISVNILL